MEAKNERRSRAKGQLQEMMKSLDSLKSSKSKERSDRMNENMAGSGEWGTIVNSIALKNGDFPGTKDISRMRDAIVNKAKDTGRD